MKYSIILKGALKKIKKGWVRGDLALNKYYGIENVKSKKAVKFCSLGAIKSKAPLYQNSFTSIACQFLVRAGKIKHDPFLYQLAIIAWNDSKRRTKKQVVVVFNKAIKLAEKEEKENA